MSGGFFRGTSVDQDARFSNKATALLQSMHFPSLYRRRVELSRVDVDALSGWVHSAVTELLGGLEDDVVASLVLSSLAQAKAAKREVDPRQLQIDLTGFLTQKGAESLVTQLWQRCIDAEQRPTPSPSTVSPPSSVPPRPVPPAATSSLPPSVSSAPSKRRSRFGPPLSHSPPAPSPSSPPATDSPPPAPLPSTRKRPIGGVSDGRQTEATEGAADDAAVEAPQRRIRH